MKIFKKEKNNPEKGKNLQKNELLKTSKNLKNSKNMKNKAEYKILVFAAAKAALNNEKKNKNESLEHNKISNWGSQ
ncbi:MAG: hypothetical protein KJ955_06045 [Nanoarchaeota archaeon]|nr:hypothetical protein [Nanoarchaeota archaeon]